MAEPHRLVLVAQPIVDLTSGAAAGYELLARVPTAWCVPPDALFARARELGLSAVLHARVVEEALRLRPTLPANTFLTLNIDPVDLAHPDVLGPLLAHESLNRVVVEVTEHAWPADRGPVDEAIAAIRAGGGLIAADDVGAGYAGLNQLMRLRPNFVKIDRELVNTLGNDPAAEALITAVGYLSGSLDAWVIVEGVETRSQLAALCRLGVPLAQGWLLGHPGEPWPTPTADATCPAPYDDGLDEPREAGATGSRAEEPVAGVLRPISHLYTRDEHGRYWREGEPGPCLTLAPATPIRDAVRRALARPAQVRWTALLVTDLAGDISGELVLEDLVSAALG